MRMGRKDNYPCRNALAISFHRNCELENCGRMNTLESASRVTRHSPRQRLLLGDSVVLQFPRFTSINGLIHSLSARGHEQNPRIRRAVGIKKNMGGGRWLHPVVRLPPRLPAIFTSHHSASKSCRGPSIKNLRSRQVVRAAHDGPRPPADCRIKHHPVSGATGLGAETRQFLCAPTREILCCSDCWRAVHRERLAAGPAETVRVRRRLRTSRARPRRPRRSTNFMADSHIVFLMYHGLELTGRKTPQSDPGCLRYILTQETFRSQMQ